MTEERPFRSTIKVVTRSYGISNDPSHAGATYAVAALAPKEARILLLSNPRLVSSGSVSFLVGTPETTFGGVSYPVYPDTDMDPRTLSDAEVWINCQDVITVIEEA